MIIITLLYMLLAHSAASGKYDVAFYDRWENVSSDELLRMGSHFQEVSKADSAMVCYAIIANRYHEGDNDKHSSGLAAKAMFGIGYLYMYDFYNYEQAYNYMQKSKEISERYGFTENLPYTYLNLGNISFLSMQISHGGNPENGVMQMYRRALLYAEKTKYWEAYTIIVGNILELAFESNAPGRYAPIVAEFRKKQIPHDTPRYQHVMYECMAFEAYIRKNYKEALVLLDKSGGSINPESSTERCQMRILEQKGNIFRAMGRLDDAYREMKAAQEMARQYKVKDGEVELCDKLYRICLEIGDKERAHHWQFLYYQKKDSLMTQSGIVNIDRIHFLNQISKINQQVIEIAQKRRLEHTILYALLITTAITAGFTVALARKNKKLKQRNHQIFLNSQEAIRREEEERRQRHEMQRLFDEAKQKGEQAEQGRKQKYQGSNLTETEKKRLNEELLRVFDDVDEICSESFSANRLAELTNSTYKNVSQVINEMHNKTFKQLVSEYRIQEACRRLADKENYGRLTIEGIAESVGFKSRSSFVQAFKREIGISPSEYQKEAAKV